ncbi:MAG: flagellar protein FlgN, partial [Clostridiaceae bacterium]|nr:flagellar protein FlgN [Clostridiaceae bacterium]
MKAEEYIQRLIDISSKKISLLDEILLFTRSQNEVIKGQRFDEMDQLLKERQKRMDAIDKLDEQFVVYSTRLKEVLSLSSFEELPQHNLPGTAELKKVVDSISQYIKQTKELDDENTALVKTEMKATQGQIKNANEHKRMTGAYYPKQNSGQSYFFDKKK